MRRPQSFLLLIWFIPCLLLGQSADSDSSPEALTDDDFRELLENSPFTRSLNLSDSLSLTGVAKIGEESIITLMDRESKETYVVSGKTNPQGWKLVDVSPGEGLDSLTAKITVKGREMVTVRFDDRQLNPGPKTSTSWGANSPGT